MLESAGLFGRGYVEVCGEEAGVKDGEDDKEMGQVLVCTLGGQYGKAGAQAKLCCVWGCHQGTSEGSNLSLGLESGWGNLRGKAKHYPASPEWGRKGGRAETKAEWSQWRVSARSGVSPATSRTSSSLESVISALLLSSV